MSLDTNLQGLATAAATRDKLLLTLLTGSSTITSLAALNTTAKGSVIAAINEVLAAIGGAGAVIDDVTPSTSKVYSSTKTNAVVAAAVAALVNSSPTALDTLKELSDALGADANFATTMTTALASRVRTDTAAQGLTGAQQTNATTNIGAATEANRTALMTALGTLTTDYAAIYTAALTA